MRRPDRKLLLHRLVARVVAQPPFDLDEFRVMFLRNLFQDLVDFTHLGGAVLDIQVTQLRCGSLFRQSGRRANRPHLWDQPTDDSLAFAQLISVGK